MLFILIFENQTTENVDILHGWANILYDTGLFIQAGYYNIIGIWKPDNRKLGYPIRVGYPTM